MSFIKPNTWWLSPPAFPFLSQQSLYYESSLTQLAAINFRLQSPHNLLSSPINFFESQLEYSLCVQQSELSVKIHVAHLQHQISAAVFQLRICFPNVHLFLTDVVAVPADALGLWDLPALRDPRLHFQQCHKVKILSQHKGDRVYHQPCWHLLLGGPIVLNKKK